MSMLWGGWLNPLGLDAHTDARKALKKDEWNRITIQAVGDTWRFTLKRGPHRIGDLRRKGTHFSKLG